MRAITLLYHDIVDDSAFSSSGFQGAEADVYKMDREEFLRHVRAIDLASDTKPVSVLDVMDKHHSGPPPLLTFDDGGVGAFPRTMDILDDLGWKGHFFITVDYIGKPGFLSKEQIRELSSCGHEVGSHSCSHPPRFSHLSHDQMSEEWQRSITTLSDILGQPVKPLRYPAGFIRGRLPRPPPTLVSRLSLTRNR